MAKFDMVEVILLMWLHTVYIAAIWLILGYECLQRNITLKWYIRLGLTTSAIGSIVLTIALYYL